ncbi:MAG TPA: class I SAM-dependent methyltransferase [Chitinophagaceae bacterium]|nr:class I SAM-dependent methyltransferase [Chitinophagaceae bacterium]
MKQFWNQRYREHTTVYGEAPNEFFREFIDLHQPGTLLLPAEGEGRNAIYAARQGWQVFAFDFSEVAQEKALARAAREKVAIQYELMSLDEYRPLRSYDLVALIYVHMAEPLRTAFHQAAAESLRPGGFLILEAYSRDQLRFDSGGPREEALLYDAATLYHDFHPRLHVISCNQEEVDLREGPFHQGKASVVRLIARNL